MFLQINIIYNNKKHKTDNKMPFRSDGGNHSD